MKKICNTLSTILLIAIFALAMAFIVPMLMGLKVMAVMSGSMEPNVSVGSIVCVDDDVSADKIKTGDVITYTIPSNIYITHRVVSIDNDNETLITKGDANDIEDAAIDFNQVYGKVVLKIPYLGFLSANIKTPVGIMSATVLLAVIILLNTLPMLLDKDESKMNRPAEEKG